MQAYLVEIYFFVKFHLEWHAFCVQLPAQPIRALDCFALMCKASFVREGSSAPGYVSEDSLWQKKSLVFRIGNTILLESGLSLRFLNSLRR